MKYQKWNIKDIPSDAVKKLMDAGYNYLVSAVLVSRGITSTVGAEEFLWADSKLTLSPFLMKDMDLAVARIRLALERGEKIAVFGDYDVDGITSTCILMDYLISVGADCTKYIPDRVEDGYGLSCEPLKRLAEQGVSLVITVDCGITGAEETEYAKTLGLDLVITDHHECKGSLPNAVAVVDPHRSDCEYPFKYLAGVGVALKLILALGGSENEALLFSRYCSLAALGTIADVMRMSGENRTIVTCGLDALSNSDFKGLHALLKETNLADKAVSCVNVGFVLSPRINAAGRLGKSDGGGADVAAELLLTRDSGRAEELAKYLCDLNRKRQEIEQVIALEADACIKQMPENQRNALVVASESWNPGVVGIVASRLSETYSCPAFVIHINGGIGKGSCRSFGGFNLFAALGECEDLLLGFGGHALAAGFTIKQENIDPFRTRMNECAERYFGNGVPVSVLDVDVKIDYPALLTLGDVETLAMLEPYGSGNARPVFCLTDVHLDALQNVGQNKHLKLRFSKGEQSFDAIFFSNNTASCNALKGDTIDVAGYININEFRDKRSIQFQLLALRNSDSTLYERFVSENAATKDEAARLLPTREQSAAMWKYLYAKTAAAPWRASKSTVLHSAAQSIGGDNAFLRAMVILNTFVDRALVACETAGEDIIISLLPKKRVVLEEAEIMQRLNSILLK